MAAIDPDRAETTAYAITDEYWKAVALSGIAKTLAAAFSWASDR